MAVALVLSTAGCSPGVGLAMSDKSRESSPNVSGTELDELVKGNSQFAFDLYKALSAEPGNIFYSPYSVSLALAMTYAGARGETEQQMAETLRFLLGQEGLHAAFNALDLELAARGQDAKGKDGEPFRLNIVNAIWGQQDYKFLTEFLDTLAENYGAGLRLLDFRNAPEESRQTINKWVSDQTEDRIKDLIPQGMIDILTRLVLTNAIYFNASWMNPFNEDLTADGAFHLLDGNEVTVPLMRQNERLGYATGDGYTAVELPYDGGEISMVILLPDEGTFREFEAAMDAGMLAEAIGNLENRTVDLTMPKFEFESEFSLRDVLAGMGMPVAFSDAADFSGMTGNRDLCISEV
ncbi:MAG: serpin family protein, partial [Dehalococcoidia bacterium]|nr:serpin family protein [Dehalococcoidia bacterium]